MPFIRHHEPVLRGLGVPWRWRIVEGVAELKGDTAWSLKTGGRFPRGMARKGLSIDGTTAYLNRLQKLHPRKISVIRQKSGCPWPGKTAMVRAAMQGVQDGDLIFQLDSDELWARSILQKAVEIFRSRPELQWARVPCRFFYGPDLYTEGERQYGNGPGEWLRFWRYRPGDTWQTHEPPCLIRCASGRPVTDEPGLDRSQSRAFGLSFDHYAYATEAQVRFKEAYYGLKQARHHWTQLRKKQPEGRLVRRFLPWVSRFEVCQTRTLRGYIERCVEPWLPGARLERLPPDGSSLARINKQGRWIFFSEPAKGLPIKNPPFRASHGLKAPNSDLIF